MMSLLKDAIPNMY